jgi:MFS transporter, ACS family, glucarate transporter
MIEWLSMVSPVPPVRSSDPVQKPTHVRYWVIFFAVTLAIITYFDRVALSKAAPTIRKDLNIDERHMGYIFGAFALAYALMEIPGGYLGDRLGPRRVLMRIVIWWSCFTAGMGMAFNFWSLYITNLLFGAGEAGCFPNITKAFAVWLPREERVRAQGFIWLAARWGGAFTPLIVYWLMQHFTWRWVFASFGLLGVAWAIAFYKWFRDNPRDNHSVNAAELELLRSNIIVGHPKVPFRQLFRSRQVVLLCLQYFMLSFGWYFYITWLPTFVQEKEHDAYIATLLTMLPLFMGGLGSFVSGMVAARAARALGSISLGRRTVAMGGFFGAGCLLIVATFMHSPLAMMLAIGFSSFCNDLVMPNAWGACMDVGGRFAGTLSGTMNMMGNLAGFVYPIVAGEIVHASHHNWNLVLYLSAVVYFVGILIWYLLDPVTPIEITEVP